MIRDRRDHSQLCQPSSGNTDIILVCSFSKTSHQTSQVFTNMIGEKPKYSLLIGQYSLRVCHFSFSQLRLVKLKNFEFLSSKAPIRYNSEVEQYVNRGRVQFLSDGHKCIFAEIF